MVSEGNAGANDFILRGKMGYAVELYFDDHIEQCIRHIRNVLFQQGIYSNLIELGERPHISLAVFSSVNVNALVSLIQDHAINISPIDIQLSAIGIFPTNENCLFLIPAVTLDLLTIHQDTLDRFAETGLISLPYYQATNWVPHCTLEMNIPSHQILKAVGICRDIFRPLQGQFREIGVVEFRPIKFLATCPLSAKPAGPE